MTRLDDDYVAAIERENEELREKVRQLEKLCGFTLDAPLEFGLTQKEGQLFSFLYRSNIVSKDAAMDVLYGDRPNDAPEMKIVDIFICKMRKKVEPFGIKIDTMWGRGYRMPPETKKLVKKYLEPEPEEQE